MEEDIITEAPALEKRVLPTAGLFIESRAIGAGVEKDHIVGCAIKFGVRSQVLGWFVEIIDPAALDGADMSDVVALYNHNNDCILGRSTAGTLILEVRAGDGLYYSIPYDETDPDHVRVKRKIDKKEVTGSSFQFSIAVRGQEWDTDPATGVEVRTITKISKIVDVGPVTFPAYLDSSSEIGQRAKRDHDSAKAEKREQEPPTPPDPTPEPLPDNSWQWQAEARSREMTM